jgi:hypothetical protein
LHRIIAVEKKLDELVKSLDSRMTGELRSTIKSDLLTLIYNKNVETFENTYAQCLKQWEEVCPQFYKYEMNTWYNIRSLWALCFRESAKNPQSGVCFDLMFCALCFFIKDLIF